VTDLRITHIGGPTVLIQFGDWRLLTDPTFDPPGQKYNFGWGTERCAADSELRDDVVPLADTMKGGGNVRGHEAAQPRAQSMGRPAERCSWSKTPSGSSGGVGWRFSVSHRATHLPTSRWLNEQRRWAGAVS